MRSNAFVIKFVTILAVVAGMQQPLQAANPCSSCQESNQESKLIGWWVNTIKGNSHDSVALWNIYKTPCGDLRVKLYAGYQGRFREWTPEDFLLLQSQILPFWGSVVTFNRDDVPLIPDHGNSWLINPTDPDDPEFLSPQQRTARLNTTHDPDIIYVYMFDPKRGDVYGDVLINSLKLERLDKQPHIEKFNSPAVDNNNPINILTNIFDEWLLNGNPKMARGYQSSDFAGVPEFHEHLCKLLTTGVCYGPTIITDVWRTRTDDPTFFPFPLSTTLVTKCPPNPRIGARALVSGYKGEYSILNNTATGWELGIADNDNGRAGAEVYGKRYYVGDEEKFMVTIIDVDTSALPPYDKKLHGTGQVTIIVDPVTSTSEYRQLTAAVHDLESFVGRNTHTQARGFFDSSTFRLYSTFADVQAGLTEGIASRFTLRSRGYGGTRSGASYVDIWYQDVSTFPAIPTNDPTGLNLNDPVWINPDSEFLAYNIDAINYLDRNRTYNLYWGLTGPAIPGAPITTDRLVSLSGGYYKTPGSQFVFQTSGYYDAPPDPAFWTLYGDYQDGFDYRNALLFGIVDPALTCGKTVAYIHLVDEASFDPAYSVSVTFTDFTDPATGLPGSVGPTAACFATMLEKLNEFRPDSYIIEIRGNGGGAVKIAPVLASFFGKTRTGYTMSISTSNRCATPKLIELQSIQDRAHFENLQDTIDDTKTMDNEQIAKLYPCSVVRGKGKKVIILTDTNAASNGDFFPHWFRDNDKSDHGDIGYGVKSYIVGDIDGRFGYASVAPSALFTNSNSNLRQDGIAVSPFVLPIEVVVAAFRSGRNNYDLANQHKTFAPDVLINFDIESTLWLDVGKIGPYPRNPIDGGNDPLILPLSTGKGQPRYEDNSTWRDRALEASIITAINDCFSDTLCVKGGGRKAKCHRR